MTSSCSICGKKINPFIQDFPLSNEFCEFRVCVSCEENRNKIFKYAKELNMEPYQELVDFFKKSIEEQSNKDISLYISNLLEEIEVIVDTEMAKRADERQNELERQKEINIYRKKIDSFMLTTANEFSGYDIIDYKGIISSEAVLGTGFLSELNANFADLFGMESDGFSNKLDEIRCIVIEKLVLKAIQKESNAIIAINFDYNMFDGNIIGLIINGTGVKIKKREEMIYVEPINAIEKLANLRANNYISQEEFEDKKKILLEKIV